MEKVAAEDGGAVHSVALVCWQEKPTFRRWGGILQRGWDVKGSTGGKTVRLDLVAQLLTHAVDLVIHAVELDIHMSDNPPRHPKDRNGGQQRAADRRSQYVKRRGINGKNDSLGGD